MSSKIVNFRVSPQQYGALQQICQQRGVRTVSALIRKTVMPLLHAPDVSKELQIESLVQSLAAQIDELQRMLRASRAEVEPLEVKSNDAATGSGRRKVG